MADRALQIVAPRYKSWKDDGTVNAGGSVYFYEAGTTTKKDTYQDAEATAANANPVVLDTRGEAAIYGKGAYKIIEYDSDDAQIGDTMDGVLIPQITAMALGLLNDTTASAMRTTLGLGTAATKDTGTATGNVVILDSVGLPAVDGSQLTNIAAGATALPRGYLAGFTLSRSATTTLGIAAGACRSDDNTTNMTLSSAYTKTLGSWAVGTTKGSLDTGSIAVSTWYHVFIIWEPTTSITDVLITTNPTTPNYPSPYTKKRRIGSFLTDGSAEITNFLQYGDEFLWLDPPADFTQSADDYIGSTAENVTLTVPSGTGTNVWAIINATGGTNNVACNVYISCPDVNNEAPTGATTPPFGQINLPAADGLRYSSGQMRIKTNTSGQVRVRAGQDEVALDIMTVGWIDQLGRI